VLFHCLFSLSLLLHLLQLLHPLFWIVLSVQTHCLYCRFCSILVNLVEGKSFPELGNFEDGLASCTDSLNLPLNVVIVIPDLLILWVCAVGTAGPSGSFSICDILQ